MNKSQYDIRLFIVINCKKYNFNIKEMIMIYYLYNIYEIMKNWQHDIIIFIVINCKTDGSNT